MSFAGMLNRLHGQPESYDKKAKYKFEKTLGAGTYGVVREAEGPTGKVAIKIIMKKNVKGNEKMVYDELELLQRLRHPHIVRFVDWFESRDKYYIVTQLATGGELFDRICSQGRFTEKDASQTIKQILGAVDYLHDNDIVHRDLKPENLLYITPDMSSDLVLADFGIAKTMSNDTEVLKTMAGSFGYAAPEVMERKGHGKPVDMWSMGVITYTLLCGYSPFRSENLSDLLLETKQSTVVFHERYWKDVSPDAKDFILRLLVPNPDLRFSSKQALEHIWLSGEVATDHDILPDFRKGIEARRRFKRAVNVVSLMKKIESLEKAEDADSNEMKDAVRGIPGLPADKVPAPSEKKSGGLFAALVDAAKKDHDNNKNAELQINQEMEKEAKRRSYQGP